MSFTNVDGLATHDGNPGGELNLSILPTPDPERTTPLIVTVSPR